VKLPGMRIKRLLLPPAVIKLFIFVGLVWASMVGPFSAILILKNIGATSLQIGAFTAISAVVGMLAQPMWGMVSDRLGSPRRVLCLCLAVSAIFFGSVLLTDRFFIAVCLLVAENFFLCCIVTLLDSHTISEVNAAPGLQYGYIRLAGSIFYGAVSFIYSWIINSFGVRALIPVSICITFIAASYGLFFAKGKWEAGADHMSVAIRKAQSHVTQDAAALLNNKQFMLFIAFVGIMALGIQPIYTYMIDMVTAVGGNAGDVPKIQAMKCVFEIPMLIFTGVIAHRRLDVRKLMLAGVGFYLVQMFGLIFADTSVMVIFFYILGTPGFILCLSGRLKYLDKITSESVRSTTITVIGACEIGLGAIAGNLAGGFILEAYGTRAVAVLGAVCLFAAMGLLIAIMKTYRFDY